MVSTRTRQSPSSKSRGGGTKSAAAATPVPVAAAAAAAGGGGGGGGARPSRKRAVATSLPSSPPSSPAAAAAATATPESKKKVRFQDKKAANGNSTKASNHSSSSPSSSSFHYEFGGPWGAFGIVLGLPVVVMALYYLCPNYTTLPSSSASSCLRWTDLGHFLTTTLPDVLKTWALQFKDSPADTLTKLAGWAEGLPPLAQAKALSLVKFIQDELWDPQVFACVVGWFAFQVLLERFLPGEVALGVPLTKAGGKRLEYRLNGHLAFWITLLVLGHGYPQFAKPLVDEVFAEGEGDILSSNGGGSGAISVLGNWQLTGFGPFPLDRLYDQFPQFAFAALVFSFLLSTGIYLASFRPGKDVLLAEGGDSGNPIYDFYMGRELNPRTGSFDWKYFCELRPGLIGWVALNLGMLMAHQRESGGNEGGGVHWPLLLLNVFQGWYVLDALLNERAILTTMDITTDGFGFMLTFGDLAWVPFTYSLQARYLVGRPSSFTTTSLVAITALQLLGYWIFRQANSTKDAFRRDPASVPHIRFLETARGTKLMISGWWGWARKINYTGDWLMSVAWCLLCGTQHVLPYFYAIYFGILLVHRAARDDHLCALKYGKDWDRYKKEVRWLFLPGVF